MGLAQSDYPADQPPDHPDRRSLRFVIAFGLLVAVDLVLIANHAFRVRANASVPDLHRITVDWSLGEMFNYLKWIALAVMSAVIAVRSGERIFAMLAAGFGLLLIDDAAQVHERGGAALLRLLGIVRFEHSVPALLASLAIWVVLAAILFVLIRHGWYRSDAATRRVVGPLALLFAIVLFSGVLLDAIHYLMNPGSWVGRSLGLGEDGGEMIGISAMTAFLFSLLPAFPAVRSR